MTDNTESKQALIKVIYNPAGDLVELFPEFKDVAVCGTIRHPLFPAAHILAGKEQAVTARHLKMGNGVMFIGLTAPMATVITLRNGAVAKQEIPTISVWAIIKPSRQVPSHAVSHPKKEATPQQSQVPTTATAWVTQATMEA